MFGNPKYNYTTDISADTTEKDARDYFVGTDYNIGTPPNYELQTCVDIEFTGAIVEGSTECECIQPTFTLSRDETVRTCTYCHKHIEQ